MTVESTKETERFLFHQSLFRFLVGLAGITTLVSFQAKQGYDFFLVALILAILLYILISHFVCSSIGKSNKAQVTRTLASLDAFLLGCLVVAIDLNPLPSLLFILTLQFNALINGGIKRLIPDNLALGLGLILLILIQQPQLHFSVDLKTSIAPLIALGIYICIYGASSFNQINGLLTKQKEVEKQLVQMKLRNYHLSKYLSPTLRKAILSGKDVKLETQRKKLTIFFSDIKGFSELSEEMEADALTSLLNNYLTEMSKIALKYGGTIDKFIGDAIMVFFGDPASHGIKEDCVAAVSMAIAMKKHMKELQQQWINQGIQKPLEIRIGINTGFCTVGNFGTENRLDYTLLGTEVNLASRLESAAEPGEILISHETYSLVKDLIMCYDKGEIQVKGYQQPVRVHSALDLRKNLGKEQTYFEHLTNGFSIYMDLDRVRNYDKDKIMDSLIDAANCLKSKDIF
ncbi:MAG TPA: adenylate/guanylate cyclase domain-containing protein [Porticoccus sp.]|nr:adenylate/guanylate cyclase domain-containing protein [Porticoccus sp.]